MLDQLFGVTGHVSGAQECARAVVVFAYGLVAVRIAGRRSFARWSALDIVVATVVGSSLSRALTGQANLGGTIAATTALMLLHAILARSVARWPWCSKLVEGGPIRLGEAGNLNATLLIRHGVSKVDLDEALHGAGVRDESEARLVVLEPSGRISVLKADVP